MSMGLTLFSMKHVLMDQKCTGGSSLRITLLGNFFVIMIGSPVAGIELDIQPA